MNEIRRPIREDEEIDRIRKIVGRHQLPDFVTNFEVLLSTVDAEPAVWIIFHTVGSRPKSVEARKALADTLNNLVDIVHQDLRREVTDRYPYFRFLSSEQNSWTSSDRL